VFSEMDPTSIDFDIDRFLANEYQSNSFRAAFSNRLNIEVADFDGFLSLINGSGASERW
jgi:hypothetical protein